MYTTGSSLLLYTVKSQAPVCLRTSNLSLTFAVCSLCICVCSEASCAAAAAEAEGGTAARAAAGEGAGAGEAADSQACQEGLETSAVHQHLVTT